MQNWWEGRFKSQALLDEAALMACMAYVDLNPIRARMVDTPETSAHTSIKKRIDSLKESKTQPSSLLPFLGYEKEAQPNQQSIKGLPFRFTDYLELVDLTGRIIREDKRGSIDASLTPILQRIGLSSAQWLAVTTQFETHFKTAVGKEASLTHYCEKTHKQRRLNVSQCRKYLS